MKDSGLQIIICLGKSLNNDLKPDRILQGRLNMTIEVAKRFPNAKIILTGGQSHKLKEDRSKTEAQGMYEYVVNSSPELKDRIILEEKGNSTIHQLVIIKTEILVPNKIKHIGLVTDEVHMPRAELVAKHILGEDFTVFSYASRLNISDEQIADYREREKKGYRLTVKTRTSVIKPGDHETWLRLNEEWKNLSAEEQEKILKTTK